MGYMAAGSDPVALDAWIGELLGHKPEDLPTVATGHARGLGNMHYRELKVKELTVA